MPTPASYLPESMLIKVAPEMRVLTPGGGLIGPPTPVAFGFLFHEYVHFLHNLSTASGIVALVNTLSLWRHFRLSIDESGFSRGSKSMSGEYRSILKTLMGYLDVARKLRRPAYASTSAPISATITSFAIVPEIRDSLERTFISRIVCTADVHYNDGHSEVSEVTIGTLEILEASAWLLEKRLVTKLVREEELFPPPIFPNLIAGLLIDHVAPGLDDSDKLRCLLTSLQSSDSPAGLVEVLRIVSKWLDSGRDIKSELYTAATLALALGSETREDAFRSLESEYCNEGHLAKAVRQVIASSRIGFELRRSDPFFEIGLIDQLLSGRISPRNLFTRVPACGILQINDGDPSAIDRDVLSTFSRQQEPNDENLRVLQCAFDFIDRHRTGDESYSFKRTRDARQGPCPFYTCCSLDLRRDHPALCLRKPWEAVDWPGRETLGLCWYGVAVLITRPPPK